MPSLVATTSALACKCVCARTSFALIKEVSGHMAAVGHTWALGNAQNHRDTDIALVHGV